MTFPIIIMLTLLAFIAGGTLGVCFMAALIASRRAEDEHEKLYTERYEEER